MRASGKILATFQVTHYTCTYKNTGTSIHPSIHPFIHSFIHLSTHPVVHAFVRSSIIHFIQEVLFNREFKVCANAILNFPYFCLILLCGRNTVKLQSKRVCMRLWIRMCENFVWSVTIIESQYCTTSVPVAQLWLFWRVGYFGRGNDQH